jgi:hypothetical protein
MMVLGARFLLAHQYSIIPWYDGIITGPWDVKSGVEGFDQLDESESTVLPITSPMRLVSA